MSPHFCPAKPIGSFSGLVWQSLSPTCLDALATRLVQPNVLYAGHSPGPGWMSCMALVHVDLVHQAPTQNSALGNQVGRPARGAPVWWPATSNRDRRDERQSGTAPAGACFGTAPVRPIRWRPSPKGSLLSVGRHAPRSGHGMTHFLCDHELHPTLSGAERISAG